jgi:hypothetical protein
MLGCIGLGELVDDVSDCAVGFLFHVCYYIVFNAEV